MFQIMMNTIFRKEVYDGWLSVYIDNIAIHSKELHNKTKEQHRHRHARYVHQVLDKLETHDLYLKPEKCKFLKEEIDYLGVIVGRNQLRMDPGKLQSIREWKTPQNPMEI